MTSANAASSRVHSRSPVRSSPSPVLLVAKHPLRRYFWLRTLPLPGTHAEVGDRLRHWPGGVLRLLTQDKRLAHRTRFAHFIAEQIALLVLHAADLRVLQLLQVESDHLLGKGGDGAQPAQPLDPGEDIFNAAQQGWGEPPLLPATIGKARRSISGAAVSAPVGASPGLL